MLVAPWDAEQRGLGGFAVASLVALVVTAVAVRRSVGAAESRDRRAAH